METQTRIEANVPAAELQQADRNTVFHPFTQLHDHASGKSGGPRIIESGEGVRITDAEGNSLIDAFAGLYCVNVGYGRREIADAIHEQAQKLAYYHIYVGHSNEPVIKLSERIISMAPAGMSKVFYGMSGSDANETNVKLVWYYNNVLGRTHKKKIISRLRGYHGGTIMAGSLTGLPVYHKAFDLPLPQVRHTVAPHYYWQAEAGMSEEEFSQYCAEELEKLIIREDPDTVAAFIGEPVLGTGGIIPPPAGYWDKIQAVLKKYDVLLIDDEVICGFGRIGSAFGADIYGMKPDLMTVAKGLTSAYVPLSGSIVGERMWEVLEEGSDRLGPNGHGYTYSGHALGAAAGLANLDIIERENLTDNARDTGAYFQSCLHEAFDNHPLVGEVRGIGLLAAVECVADKNRKLRFDPNLKVGGRLAAACVANGVIARGMPHSDALGFAPPLIITRDEVDEVVALTRKAVDQVTDELVREGAWKA